MPGVGWLATEHGACRDVPNLERQAMAAKKMHLHMLQCNIAPPLCAAQQRSKRKYAKHLSVLQTQGITLPSWS